MARTPQEDAPLAAAGAPPASRASRWSVYRRPALLASLVAGLVAFLVWLPGGARAALFAALWAEQALVGLLGLFALVALSLVWSAGQRLDTWVFLRFNLGGYHSGWLDRVMWLATQAGSIVAAALAAGLFIALNDRALAAEVVLGTLTLWLVVETLKVLTDRARPFLVLAGTRIVGWRERGCSFPSGHTAQVFFLATLLSQRFEPGLAGTVALFAVAGLVGFTRVYVGAHYPRDVIGGAVLGSVGGVLATLVQPYWLGPRF
jgi:membrane-associated phospholipid phosphatase